MRNSDTRHKKIYSVIKDLKDGDIIIHRGDMKTYNDFVHGLMKYSEPLKLPKIIVVHLQDSNTLEILSDEDKSKLKELLCFSNYERDSL